DAVVIRHGRAVQATYWPRTDRGMQRGKQLATPKIPQSRALVVGCRHEDRFRLILRKAADRARVRTRVQHNGGRLLTRAGAEGYPWDDEHECSQHTHGEAVPVRNASLCANGC